jgi:hypothetical protein
MEISKRQWYHMLNFSEETILPCVLTRVSQPDHGLCVSALWESNSLPACLEDLFNCLFDGGREWDLQENA